MNSVYENTNAIFDNAEEQTSEVYFSISGATGRSDKIKLTYIDRLHQFQIQPDVIDWIVNYVTSLDRKIGKITDEHLYVFIYTANQALGITVDPYVLAKMLNINLKTSAVTKMISGTHGLISPVSDLTVTIPISVIHPKEFIPQIIMLASTRIQIPYNLEDLINSIVIFCEQICIRNKFLLQNSPKNMGAAVTYLYMSRLPSGDKLGKSVFFDNDVNDRLFTQCFNKLKKTIEQL